jgi:acyl transferase domain-containing protein
VPVFGDNARRLAISSSKAVLGHSLGAAGALEAMVSVLAIHHAVAPPTANFIEADPACDLDYVPNEARDLPIKVAISNSFAFGGLNAVIALRRFEDEVGARASCPLRSVLNTALSAIPPACAACDYTTGELPPSTLMAQPVT